ncbi:hypothetical protein FQZ97_923450 [compost metagenome]
MVCFWKRGEARLSWRANCRMATVNPTRRSTFRPTTQWRSPQPMCCARLPTVTACVRFWRPGLVCPIICTNHRQVRAGIRWPPRSATPSRSASSRRPKLRSESTCSTVRATVSWPKPSRTPCRISWVLSPKTTWRNSRSSSACAQIFGRSSAGLPRPPPSVVKDLAAQIRCWPKRKRSA